MNKNNIGGTRTKPKGRANKISIWRKRNSIYKDRAKDIIKDKFNRYNNYIKSEYIIISFNRSKSVLTKRWTESHLEKLSWEEVPKFASLSTHELPSLYIREKQKKVLQPRPELKRKWAIEKKID